MTRTYKVLISLALAAVLLAGGLALLKKSSGQRAPSAAPAVVQAPAGAQPPESVRSEMAGEPAPWESAQEDVSSTSARTSTSLPPASLPKAHAALSIAQMDQQIAMQEAQATAILQQLDLAEAQGTLPPDLNPEAVRTNLKVALKAQKLGRELIALTQQPGTPERQRRIAQITAEMTALQHELRKDVMVAAGAGAKR